MAAGLYNETHDRSRLQEEGSDFLRRFESGFGGDEDLTSQWLDTDVMVSHKSF